jgi:hypothetical protein
MASTVLTKSSTGVKGTTGKKRWRLAGQHRAGIHCSIAIDGVRDAHQEADYAADTSTDDIALRRRRDDAGSTVREYLARIAAAGITWPLPAELSDGELCGPEHAITWSRTGRRSRGS